MIPKRPVPGLIGDGNRFSDRIMRKQKAYLITSAGSQSDSAGMKVTSIKTANIAP